MDTRINLRPPSLKLRRVKIFANGTSAVVTYCIDMAFIYNGKEASFKGRDLFFLVKENGKWLIAANEFSPFPEKEGEEQN